MIVMLHISVCVLWSFLFYSVLVIFFKYTNFFMSEISSFEMSEICLSNDFTQFFNMIFLSTSRVTRAFARLDYTLDVSQKVCVSSNIFIFSFVSPPFAT